ncbi:MAG TPA: M48 family metalloprotease [Acidimicrobiales bacterium]
MNSSSARVARITAGFAAAPAVALALVAWVAGGLVAAAVVFVVVAGALTWWALTWGDRRVAATLSSLGAREADPVRDARLANMVEGLSMNAGVRQPRLLVVEAAGLNALAAGTSASKAVVAVTSGLLAELDRIELEAVLAEAMSQIRRGDTVAPTVAVATFGLGRRLAIASDRDALADQAAVTLTRYPPALASALEKVEAKGWEVPGQPAYMASLWLADPRPGVPQDAGRLPLSERIEALREL